MTTHVLVMTMHDYTAWGGGGGGGGQLPLLSMALQCLHQNFEILAVEIKRVRGLSRQMRVAIIFPVLVQQLPWTATPSSMPLTANVGKW